MHHSRLRTATIAIVTSLLSIFATRTQAVQYTIDPALSFIQIAIYDDSTGIPLTLPQFPGSDVTSLSGSLDVTLGGGNITLNVNNDIVYGNQLVAQKPAPGGGVPTSGTITVSPDPILVENGTANFGLQFIVPSDGGGLLDPTYPNAAVAGWAAIRGTIADMTGTSPLAGGLFSAAPFLTTLVAGSLEYNLNLLNQNYPSIPVFGLPLANGSSSVVGAEALNSGAGNGSLIGGTLTIPISTGGPLDVDGVLVDLVLTGQIVARVPEPSTLILAALGGIVLLAMRRRR